MPEISRRALILAGCGLGLVGASLVGFAAPPETREQRRLAARLELWASFARKSSIQPNDPSLPRRALPQRSPGDSLRCGSARRGSDGSFGWMLARPGSIRVVEPVAASSRSTKVAGATKASAPEPASGSSSSGELRLEV